MIRKWINRFKAWRQRDPRHKRNQPKQSTYTAAHEVVFDYTAEEVAQAEFAANKQLYLSFSEIGWWAIRYFPHGFVFKGDVIPEDEVREFMTEHATDLWMVGKFPNFLRPAVFVRGENDALAFRMRFPAKYLTPHSSELNILAAAVGMINFFEGRKPGTRISKTR